MTGHGISSGSNSPRLDDTLAETGPGVPDDAVIDSELAPGELNRGADAAVAELKRSGWIEPSSEEAEAETQAHPS